MGTQYLDIRVLTSLLSIRDYGFHNQTSDNVIKSSRQTWSARLRNYWGKPFASVEEMPTLERDETDNVDHVTEVTNMLEEFHAEDEELVGNINPNQRNWRGIGIALLVILVVCAIVITAVILVTPNEQDVTPGAKFELDDIFSPDFKPRHFDARWLTGKDEFLFKDGRDCVVRYDAVRNESFLVMDNSTFMELESENYQASADLQYILIAYNERPVYRHSTIAQYKIKTRLKKKFDVDGGRPLQYMGWGPKGNALVFVKGNNIYYKSSVTSKTKQITTNGATNDIYNGIPDWIYEEEILGSNHALWWSPLGTYLCYAVFNDTLVPKYSYPVYGQARDVYGHINRIAYTKPGFPNPTFQLKIFHFGTEREIILRPPNIFRDIDHLFTSVTWLDDDNVSVIWSNRIQNHSIVTFCRASHGVCYDNLHEKGHGGWVELFYPPKFNGDSSLYFMVLSQKYDSSSGYFRRVTMVTAPSGNSTGEKTYLTSGKIDADSIVGYSHKKEKSTDCLR